MSRTCCYSAIVKAAVGVLTVAAETDGKTLDSANAFLKHEFDSWANGEYEPPDAHDDPAQTDVGDDGNE